MSAKKRWNVYQGGKSIGLMSAHEIRHALRAGTVDPFDLVAQEGSQIKTELVEVDEIFQEDTRANMGSGSGGKAAPQKAAPSPAAEAPAPAAAKPKPKPKPQAAPRQSEARPAPAAAKPAPRPKPQPAAKKPEPQVAKKVVEQAPPRQEQAQAQAPKAEPAREANPRSMEFADHAALREERSSNRDPRKEETQVQEMAYADSGDDENTNLNQIPKKQKSSSSANALSDRKKKEKKFYLTDEKNRVLGPLSATEVQSLFYRGILGKSVKVQKVGTNRKIPIRQFISAYSGKRMKALAEGGSVKPGANSPLPSSKVLHELYHLINSKKLAENRVIWPSVGLIILGILLGLGLFFLMEQQQKAKDEPERRSAIRKNLIQGEMPQIANESRQPSGKSTNSSTSEKARRSEISERRDAAKSSRRSRIATRAKTSNNVRELPPKVTPPPTSRRARARSRQQASAATPRGDQNSPSSAAGSRPPNNRARKSKSGPIAKAKENAGGVLSVGPLTYRQSDLEACSIKCEIPFRDSQGDTLTAVFFKGAYSSQLASKGSVVLTGSSKVKGGKLVLFIQDIR